MEEKNQVKKSHSFMMENRKKCRLTGVTDVISFDLNTVILECGDCMLTLKGSNLHVGSLSIEKGEIVVDGQFVKAEYSAIKTMAKKGESLFNRLLS